MGRIKSTGTKKLGDELIEKHGKLFTDNFDENKNVLEKIIIIKSKKIRNVLAGYITKEIKRINKTGL